MPYQCVRIYRFRRGALGGVLASVRSGLLGSLMAQSGFLRYRFVTTADDRAVSESVWESEGQAAFADVVESDWVRASISNDLAGLPELLIGPVEVDVAA
ncbi:MAG: hypothetical protein ACRDIY_01095 [Chloroflexota bacterium]